MYIQGTGATGARSRTEARIPRGSQWPSTRAVQGKQGEQGCLSLVSQSNRSLETGKHIFRGCRLLKSVSSLFWCPLPWLTKYIIHNALDLLPGEDHLLLAPLIRSCGIARIFGSLSLAPLQG